VTEHETWQDANTIKSNPDSPQRPVRRRAFEVGKTVCMSVSRLRDEQCFLRLDPAVIDDYQHASIVHYKQVVEGVVGRTARSLDRLKVTPERIVQDTPQAKRLGIHWAAMKEGQTEAVPTSQTVTE
jgi:5-formyltetrahydrofolate cyclo-ligase